MEITSGGVPGPPLAEHLRDLDNNLYGSVPGDHSPEQVARHFLAAGWMVRKSSWTTYEVRTTFAELDFQRSCRDGITIFSGLVDPDDLDRLADTVTGFGLGSSLELHGPDNGPCIRGLRTEAPPRTD